MEKFKYLCENFSDLIKYPGKFLLGGQLTDELRDLLKNVYDYNLSRERTSDNALPELIINNFDEEQIWQELELQNEDSLPFLINKAARLLVSRDLSFPVVTDEMHVDKPEKKIKEPKVKVSEAVSSDDDSEDELEPSQDEESLSEDDEELLQAESPKKVKIIPSEVDDNFFKLSEMEAFLKDQEDKGDAALGVDLFGGMESENDEEDRPMYQDFFGENEKHTSNDDGEDNLDEEGEDDSDEEDNREDQQASEEDTIKKVKFNLGSNNVSSESDEDESSKVKIKNVKSSYEVREEKLRKKIAMLEDQALEEKAWPLKGEVNASVRPINSLLEEVVEFDMTQRPPPIITEETSNRLEDIIKQRIKDQAFDDVERKIKPVSTPKEFKKALVLNQEKSKLSLAEVYEQEYLKQKSDQTKDQLEKPEVEPEEHQEIKKMMKSLFLKLDALSNFFFVPKPIAPELKIVSNLPAVEVEEVAPVIASDAKLLAPEEISGSFKKSLVSREEKTKTDKRRERRKKKVHQAQKFKAKEIRDSNKPASYNDSLKKVMKFKNVAKLDEKSHLAVKTSSDFFSKLQDAVQNPQKGSQIKRKAQLPSTSAKKLKL